MNLKKTEQLQEPKVQALRKYFAIKILLVKGLCNKLDLATLKF